MTGRSLSALGLLQIYRNKRAQQRKFYAKQNVINLSMFKKFYFSLKVIKISELSESDNIVSLKLKISKMQDFEINH